jgi:hypothetical protein
MKRCIGWILIALVLVSCRTALPSHRAALLGRVRLFVESAEPGSPVLMLPQSGVRIAVQANPVLTEADLKDVGIGRVPLGPCLLLTLSPDGAQKLAGLAPAYSGRRLVLAINEVPLGVLHVGEPIVDGKVSVLVEVPDVYLPRLVATIKPGAESDSRLSE